MAKGTLSISILINERPRVISTALVSGDTFKEMEEEAEKQIKEFEERNKKLTVCCASIKVILWV